MKPRRKSVKQFSAAIYDETQIKVRKRATGGWDMTIYEPLASQVRQHCRRRKISARQFVIDLFSRDASEAKAAKVKKVKSKIQELPPDYEYAWREYGVTPAQLAAAEKRALREIAADRKAGKLIEFTGTLPRSIARRKSRRKK